jgi:RES domain-containing protein
MHDLPSLKVALTKTRALSINGRLTRLVPQLNLGGSPNWLFTSGKPNRYNPSGLKCVYFAETTLVAQIEYEQQWRGLPGANQPVTIFHAEVSLKEVVDLTDLDTLKILGLTEKDLFENWRTSGLPAMTQMLGQAVCETKWFSAIRYPSIAAKGIGKSGNNIVIFEDCLDNKDYVRILGPNDGVLAKWPL